MTAIGFDVGAVSIRYLERPHGAAYDFIQHLAANATCWGEGNAFGFYLKEEMAREAETCVAQEKGGPGQLAEIVAWMETLPWDEAGYLALTFNW